MLICRLFGLNKLFAKPLTLKLFWNASLFQRDCWLLGLPTTFLLFVEEDLNNILQETSVSCH